MRWFPLGRFHRETMTRGLRSFSPNEAVERLEDIDLGALKAAGKKLVLLDVDNTLLPHKGTELPEPVLAWMTAGQRIGIEFCILSNTNRVERLQKLADSVGVSFVRDRSKPSRKMYTMALEKFGVEPEEAVMIGDQILTDVLGANRSHIDSIWVRPIDSNEFVGTRYLSRVIERPIRVFLYRHLEPAEPGDDVPFVPHWGPFRFKIFRQFVKFGVVGVSSAIIDIGLHWLLFKQVTWDGVRISVPVGEWMSAQPIVQSLFSSLGADDLAESAAFFVFKCVSVPLAILNGYVWNRRWTFGITEPEGRRRQLAVFYAVALIGFGLNTLISTFTFSRLPESFAQRYMVAVLIATVIVAIWNFLGHRFVTFGKAAK